jgi:cobalt-zinc-cadmium efflux system outer membrane protein
MVKLKINSIWMIYILVHLLSAYIYPKSYAQRSDTLVVSLKEAEEKFLKENLQLIASKYNISAADAQITQAKLWNNPNLSIEQNIYNQSTKRYFDFTRTGNTELQIEQLFLLAGKKEKQVHVSEINKQITEFSFYDLLRNLKYQLRTDFYNLYFLQNSLRFYDHSIPNITKTILSVENAYNKRTMLLSEVIRLKALLLSLENEKLGIVTQVSELQNDMRVLMHDTTKNSIYYIPNIDIQKYDKVEFDKMSVDEIIQTGINNRPDYKSAESTIKLDEANLNLQNSLAVPDLTIGGRWSRAGSYIPEYYALSFSIDLPFFNRNQGNIESAKLNLLSDESSRQQSRNNAEREILNAFHKAAETDKLYKSIDKKFISQYDTLAEGVAENFRNRNITIVEFTDFYESYRASIIQLNQIQNNMIDAIENLNFRTGTDLINP